MDVIKIEIPNLLILEPKVFGDSYSGRSVLRGCTEKCPAVLHSGFGNAAIESPRVLRRLRYLRKWSHEKNE
ncbi:MAG: hypothetical protein E6Q59_05090 [Nitrosomonas sp.]|nr:MAG: hypothetical protein E6Q59_05090 [Nitrosomonas sp.]